MSASWPRPLPCPSEEDEAPAAAEPESFDSPDWVWDCCCCVLPDAAPPALDCVDGVEADALPLAWLALELLPLELDGALPPVPDVPLLVLDGALLVPDGALPPDAFVDPEALPEPDDWLVCAPWFMVDDGLVVVALWFALTPLETFWSPVPALIPGLMFAPALTSLLLMPTFASTPTFGFTLTPPEGDVLLVEPELCVVCDC